MIMGKNSVSKQDLILLHVVGPMTEIDTTVEVVDDDMIIVVGVEVDDPREIIAAMIGGVAIETKNHRKYKI
jgi:SOS-response transcriptional repressor LexA